MSVREQLNKVLGNAIGGSWYMDQQIGIKGHSSSSGREGVRFP